MKWFILVLTVLCLLTTACSFEVTSKVKSFGVVLVGPYNDHGWSEAHYEAGKYVEGKTDYTMVYLDKLNPADRAGTTLVQITDDMVSKGATVIFTTSDDFKDETRLAAQKYPKVNFVHISGDDVWTGKAPKNLTNYMGRMEYTKAIAGCAAAMTTQTGKVGYLGPLINEETRRLAASAYLGAKSCYSTYRGKTDLKFDVKWIGFWFNIPGVTLDPTKVAGDMLASGVDVLMSGIDTPEALMVVGQKAKQGQKVWAIPYDYHDACAGAPEACLGVPYFNWGPYYLRTIKAHFDGKFKSAFEWEGPNWKNINDPDTSAVGFAEGPALSSQARSAVNEYTAALASGKADVFVGPLSYQDGSVFLASGMKATDKQVWYLSQLLSGMTGLSK